MCYAQQHIVSIRYEIHERTIHEKRNLITLTKWIRQQDIREQPDNKNKYDMTCTVSLCGAQWKWRRRIVNVRYRVGLWLKRQRTQLGTQGVRAWEPRDTRAQRPTHTLRMRRHKEDDTNIGSMVVWTTTAMLICLMALDDDADDAKSYHIGCIYSVFGSQQWSGS